MPTLAPLRQRNARAVVYHAECDDDRKSGVNHCHVGLQRSEQGAVIHKRKPLYPHAADGWHRFDYSVELISFLASRAKLTLLTVGPSRISWLRLANSIMPWMPSPRLGRTPARNGAALTLQQVNLDEITDTYAKNLREPGRDGEAAFGQGDGVQVHVDDSSRSASRGLPLMIRRSMLP